MSPRAPSDGAVPAAPAPSWGPLEAAFVIVAAEAVLLVTGSIAASTHCAAIGSPACRVFTDRYRRGEVELPIGYQFAALLGFWLFALALARFVIRRSGGDPLRDLRLKVRPLDVPVGIVLGVVTQLVVIPLLYVPILHWTHSSSHELEQKAQALGDSALGPLGTVLFVVMTCLAAPFVEEILYRGMLMGSLERRNRALALVLSAAVFAALHLQLLQFAGLFVFGLVAGALVMRTKRLGSSMVLHMAFNATTVIALLAKR